MSDELVLAGEVLDILHDLWPRPPHATVQLETHQWVRLRRTLLKVIEHLDDESVEAAIHDHMAGRAADTSGDQTQFLPLVPSASVHGSSPWRRSLYPSAE